MANKSATIKTNLSRLTPNVNGGDLKILLHDTWTLCSDVAGDAASDILLGQTLSGGDITKLVIESSLLALDIGIAIYRSTCMRKQLALCLAEYTLAGLLELEQEQQREKRSARWTTTAAFQPIELLASLYEDVGTYLRTEGISFKELKHALNLQDNDNDSLVVIYANNSSVKDVTAQLSSFCESGGALQDITKTDLNKRLNSVQFPKVAAAALANACAVEADYRAGRAREGLEPEDRVVPVLGRAIALAAVSGIRELNVRDVKTILGKAPLFETVARQRIANVRGHHASQIINTLLFTGRTDFSTTYPNGPRVKVGLIKEQGHPRLYKEWTQHNCRFTEDKVNVTEIPFNTPIYMQAGWAKLLQQREALPRVCPGSKKLERTYVEDCNGNVYHRYTDALPLIWFKVRRLSAADGDGDEYDADGNQILVIAIPAFFAQIPYAGSADFRRGSSKTLASGTEKHFGGLVGPSECKCAAATEPDVRKMSITHQRRFGNDALKLAHRGFVNSIQHTNNLDSRTIGLLWNTGDWAMGVFLMQMLPQSSYLQGRGQCMHCAIECAALAGCPEVIICGGGRVSTEAMMGRTQQWTAFPTTVSTPSTEDDADSTTSATSPPVFAHTTSPTSFAGYSSPIDSIHGTENDNARFDDFAAQQTSPVDLANVASHRPSLAVSRKPLSQSSVPTIRRKPVSNHSRALSTPGSSAKRHEFEDKRALHVRTMDSVVGDDDTGAIEEVSLLSLTQTSSSSSSTLLHGVPELLAEEDQPKGLEDVGVMAGDPADGALKNQGIVVSSNLIMPITMKRRPVQGRRDARASGHNQG